MAALQMWGVPAADEVQLGRPAGGPAAHEADGFDEGGPVRGAGGGRVECVDGRQRIGRLRDAIEQSLRRGRSGTGQQLDHAKSRDPIARVLGPAQKRQHVLDVGGFEELEPAEFHERNVAAGELDFERRAVMRRPKQHRLRLERDARFAVFQNLAGDITRLIGLVAHVHEPRPLGGEAVRPEILGETLLRGVDDGVRGGQDGLGRSVIAVERDDLGRRGEVAGKVEDVAHRRRAERVDRLRIVAHHRQADAAGLERQQDRCLQPVGVLILVHQHVIEALGDVGGDGRLRHHLRPVEQEIVVVEHMLALLGLDVSREQPAQLGFPDRAPGKRRAQHVRQAKFPHSRRVNRSRDRFPWRESAAAFSRSRDHAGSD